MNPWEVAYAATVSALRSIKDWIAHPVRKFKMCVWYYERRKP